MFGRRKKEELSQAQILLKKDEAEVQKYDETVVKESEQEEALFYTGYEENQESIDEMTEQNNPFYRNMGQAEGFRKTTRLIAYQNYEVPEYQDRYRAEYRELLDKPEPYYYMSKETYKKFMIFIGFISFGISMIFANFIKCLMNYGLLPGLRKLMYNAGLIPFGKNYYEWTMMILFVMGMGTIIYIQLYLAKEHIIAKDIIAMGIISIGGFLLTLDAYIFDQPIKILKMILFFMIAIVFIYALIKFQTELKKAMRPVGILLIICFLVCTVCKISGSEHDDYIVLMGANPAAFEQIIDRHGWETPSFLYEDGQDPNYDYENKRRKEPGQIAEEAE